MIEPEKNEAQETETLAEIVPINQAAEPIVQLYTQMMDMVNNTIPAVCEKLAEDRNGLAQLLKAHRQVAEVWKVADDFIQSELLKHDFGYGGEQIPGVGWAQIRKTADKKRYQNGKLVTIAKEEMSQREFLTDAETGEIKTNEQVVNDVWDAVVELFGVMNLSFNNWRSKQSAEILGIELSKFVDSEGGKNVIQFS